MIINRKGLTISCEEKILPSVGSRNVPITLVTDGSYSNYSTIMLVGFLYKGKEYRLKVEETNGKFKIPKAVFLEKGEIVINFKLISSEDDFVTTPLSFYSPYAADEETELPETSEWQTEVKAFFDSLTNESIQEKVNTFLDGNEKIISIDDTLSESGKAADAKIVGDKIKDLTTEINKKITIDKLSDDLKKKIEETDLTSLVLSTKEENGETYIIIGDAGGELARTAIPSGGGAAFTGGYVDESGYLHFVNGEVEVEDIDPIFVGLGGGASSGSKLTFAMYTASSMSVLESSTEALLKGKYTSVDAETGVETGQGNLAIYVGDVLRENKSINQGDFEIDVRKYLSVGSNSVKLTITDSYGATATRKSAITLETFKVEWNLSSTLKNTEDTLNFYITPTGSGTKNIYTYVDGLLYSNDEVTTSGRRLTKNITGLSHGMHTIEVYGEMTVNGAILESNHLNCAVAQIKGSDTTPVIAVNWPTEDIPQYTTFAIEHLVVDPSNNPTTVSYLVNGVVYATEELDQSSHVWSYRPMTAGTFTLGIMCGTKLVEEEIVVTSIGSDIQEVIDGLEVKVDPSVMTSLNDWAYGNYQFSFSDGFDHVNGGLQTDEDGIHCIKIIKGDRLNLNYQPFASDARKSGKELKFIYKIQNSTQLNAEAISCVSGGIGLTIRANDVSCKAEQTTVQMDTCEDEKTELDINIQQDNEERLMSIWEQCSSFAYTQYPTSENFTQSSPVDITFGSDECDVILYLFRAYNRELTEEELKSNFCADGKDGTEILNRSNRNKIYDGSGRIDLNAVASLNPNLHVMTFHGERLSLGKDDEVSGNFSHVYVAGGEGHTWTAYFCITVVQGTSSVEHAATAGGNQDVILQQGITLEDGSVAEGYAMSKTAKPVSKFTYKKNIASQDHIINSAMSEWYHRYQPSVRAIRNEDPGVRDCMESEMAVLFFHNTGTSTVQIGPDLVQPDETTFYGLGNLCNSKDNVEVFSYDPIVIEVRNNTEPQVRFKSDDLSNFDDNYKFRYLDESQFSKEEAIALFQEMQTFVYSCDYTAATNTALSKAETFNGQTFTVDSPTYRKAKWKAEAANYFDMDSILYHQNFTLHYLGRDSRAKNMFWAYNPTTKKWNLIFLWDLDTFICVNNEGLVDIQPGHLDTDVEGTKDIFNAADNVIFTNNREVFFDELRENYLSCESAGAWDIDKLLEFITERQEYACESLWIEDVLHNDIRTLTNLGTNSYLPRATGKKRLLIKKALKLQKAFIASYYLSTSATNDSASFRGYTPSEWKGVAPSGLIQITPYCNLFINIHAGSIDYQLRANAGETVEVDIQSSLNDSEMYIRSAEWIQGLGDLSGLYIGDCNFANMKRATEFLIGSDVEGYENTNFKTALFDNCASLEYVNLGGLVNTQQAYDFSPNLMLKEIYTKGSGVTGVKFAKNGRLETAQLNPIASLEISGLRKLETLEIESYDNLTSLVIEDCPTVDSYQIAKASSNLARVRLLDILWNVTVAAYDVLMHLDSIQGIDDDGYNTDQGVITGNVYFNSISETKYNTLVETIPTVTFTYGERLEEVTATFVNDDGTVLYVAKTEKGGSIQDPVAAGLIDTPTKESTIEYTYTYYKWDTALDAILQDCTIKATYLQATRTYTVQYVDYDGSILQEYTGVAAYGSCSYTGAELSRAGYVWTGWDKTADNVTEDMIITATYDYPTLPSEVKDVSQYDYAYSDDENDTSAYTFGELYSIIKMGRTAEYLPIGSKIKMLISTSAVTDTEVVYKLHSIGHYDLADGSGMSKADFYMHGVFASGRRMNPTNSNAGGWDSSEMRTWLNETLYPSLPCHWRQLIASSITLASAGGQSATIVESTDYLRIPCISEMGFETTAVPYKNEVSENAAELTFSLYTDNNSRIKKTFNGEGSAQNYWMRSADASSASNFRYINNNGNANSNSATYYYFVCAGFSC